MFRTVRCALTLLVLVAVVMVSGCGSPTKPFVHVSKSGRFGPHRFGDVASPAVGDVFTAGSGQWSGSPTGFAYAWKDCDSGGGSCTTAAGSPTNMSRYQVVSGDAGFTIRVAVTASYSGHPDATVMSAPTGVVPSGSAVVGTAGAPTPSCSTTVALNGNISAALGSATSGETICLHSGTWSSEPSITNSTSVPVTLAAATPGATTLPGLLIDATQSNLTIEGLSMTQGFYLEAGGSYTLQYNTSEGWGNSSMDAQTNSAYFPCPGCGAGGSFSATIQYNQIDHVPQCLQDDGPGNLTFEHNVCGPAIGNGGEADVHYMQAENISNDTFDNNAFIGPLDAGAGGHPNVLHSWGSNITFDNNILWHVDGFQHIQMNDDGNGSNYDVSNNLAVENPSETSGAFEQIAQCVPSACATPQSVAGLTNNTNTVVGASGETADDYTVGGSPTSCTVTNNIGVINGSFAVASSCTANHNVSSDTSATGTGSVTSWTPSWQNTTWTPTSGSPWSAPPSNYYKPVAGGGVTSSMGYQGSIGP